MSQVHKEQLTAVDNALPNRSSLDVEIFGMEGVPDDVIQSHNQRVIAQFQQAEAERQAVTGNPPPGAGSGGQPSKRPKLEDVSDLKKRLAEHKARKAEIAAGGSSGEATPVGAGQTQAPAPAGYVSFLVSIPCILQHPDTNSSCSCRPTLLRLQPPRPHNLHILHPMQEPALHFPRRQAPCIQISHQVHKHSTLFSIHLLDTLRSHIRLVLLRKLPHPMGQRRLLFRYHRINKLPPHTQSLKLRRHSHNVLVACRPHLASHSAPLSNPRQLMPIKCNKYTWATLFRMLECILLFRMAEGHQERKLHRYHLQSMTLSLGQRMKLTRPRPKLQLVQVQPLKRSRRRRTRANRHAWYTLIMKPVRRKRWLDCQGTHLFLTAEEKRHLKSSLLL